MNDDEPVDPLVALRAQIDQMAALAPEVARMARGWFEAFQVQGFSEKQALYLAAVQVVQNPGAPPA